MLSSQKLFRPYGQLSNAFAGGIKHGICDGSFHADDADFTDAFDTQRINPIILPAANAETTRGTRISRAEPRDMAMPLSFPSS